jgi:hypothetical protein
MTRRVKSGRFEYLALFDVAFTTIAAFTKRMPQIRAAYMICGAPNHRATAISLPRPNVSKMVGIGFGRTISMPADRRLMALPEIGPLGELE